MGVIFTPKHMTRQREQCVHTHIQIMRYHTRNMYFDVVPNVQALILLTRKQMISIPTPVLQFFHIYHLSERCTKQDRLPLTDRKSCRKCQQDTASGQSTRIYTRKELVMMETTIYNFNTSFYVPEIQKLAFHSTHVKILGTSHCGNSRQTAFKRRK